MSQWLTTLAAMLNDPNPVTQNVIHWNPVGNGFVIESVRVRG